MPQRQNRLVKPDMVAAPDFFKVMEIRGLNERRLQWVFQEIFSNDSVTGLIHTDETAVLQMVEL
ncbi:hypothetical protein F4167_06970 [Candidatus Poribacteria bacterium]|nr:hypothetical protein [Candidatus Poribacteria bacterium]